MSQKDKYQKLLDSALDHPQVLDQLWSAYIETNNTEFILKIVSVLDWEDRVRDHLDTWLQQTSLEVFSNYHQKFVD